MFNEDFSPQPRPRADKPRTEPGNKVAAGGLRYQSKAAGSPFAGQGNGFGSAQSCFKCGTHRAPSELVSKKLLGSHKRVCKDGCPPKR